VTRRDLVEEKKTTEKKSSRSASAAPINSKKLKPVTRHNVDAKPAEKPKSNEN
jgi:hypothetical protein